MILPAQLDLPAPFPRVVAQAPQIERIAPGVEYADYELSTQDGPISIHVVAVDPRNPDVNIRTVLANNALGPDAETVSSMAQRTGAIAGVNADYFDIGRSNHPTNIVVRDGTLLRSPRKRYALAILRSGEARFAEFSFTGTVQIGTQSLPLDAINALPSGPGSITLITPAFGEVAADTDATFAALQPTEAATFGAYRITALDTGAQVQPSGYYLAIGNGSEETPLPNVGDAVVVSGDLSPFALSQLSCVAGGGPLILRDGRWFDDPDGPTSELDRRIPSSGAALDPDGSLLLVEVDGRQPQISIGLTRPELAEVMRALGADEGIAFDGGGSAEMAVQVPGEPTALLETSPSDGAERRVADGIFVYNVAPVTAPAAIASDPQVIRALPGARVPLHLEVVDASERPLGERSPIAATVEPESLGRVLADGSFVAARPGEGIIRLQSDTVTGSIPVRVDTAAARVVIAPEELNLDPYEAVTLKARAFDAEGFSLWLPSSLDWSATNGSIDDLGRLVVADRDAEVHLDLAGRIEDLRVTVGHHDVPLDFGGEVRFLTLPGGGLGAASAQPGCTTCLRLQYALGTSEHAAYAIVERALPDASVGLSFIEQDDGGGALLRVVVRNAIDEQTLITAAALDGGGQRRITVRFPRGILQPVRLVGFYVIGTKDTGTANGSVTISDVRALVAGTP